MIFTDALPDATLPIHPGQLQQAIRNALALVSPAVGEPKKKAHISDLKLQRETEHILALDKCTGAHAESVESFRKSRDFAQKKCP